ncbi:MULTISPECIES: small, acid-soluble spore protein, H family [Priestia]|nr:MULTISPECIES: small, acid-soluble spore protein, H family [Priestia]
MDVQRAQEIADSVDMVSVIYNGKSIYIEDIERGIIA